ncbi:hypothetical protein [Salana multivorans]
MLGSAGFGLFLRNSAFVALGTVLTAFVALLAAVAVGRFTFKFRTAVLVLILVVLARWRRWSSCLQARNLNMLDLLPALTVVYLAFSLPFAIWTAVSGGFVQAVPLEIEEAAYSRTRFVGTNLLVDPRAAGGSRCRSRDERVRVHHGVERVHLRLRLPPGRVEVPSRVLGCSASSAPKAPPTGRSWRPQRPDSDRHLLRGDPEQAVLRSRSEQSRAEPASQEAWSTSSTVSSCPASPGPSCRVAARLSRLARASCCSGQNTPDLTTTRARTPALHTRAPEPALAIDEEVATPPGSRRPPAAECPGARCR